jgi:hypothetical protein
MIVKAIPHQMHPKDPLVGPYWIDSIHVDTKSHHFPFKNTGMQRQQGPAPPLGGSPHPISGYKWLITIVITILITIVITIVITCYEPFKDGICH